MMNEGSILVILVNKATTPDNTVYFIAAALNGILNQRDCLNYTDLYDTACSVLHKSRINTTVFMLALDFLFLLDKIYVDKDGKIHVLKNTKINSKRR